MGLLPMRGSGGETSRVVTKLPEADELGAGKGRHFSKRISSGTHAQCFGLFFEVVVPLLVWELNGLERRVGQCRPMRCDRKGTCRASCLHT